MSYLVEISAVLLESTSYASLTETIASSDFASNQIFKDLRYARPRSCESLLPAGLEKAIQAQTVLTFEISIVAYLETCGNLLKNN
jgi:hypothetical protein